MCHTPLISQVTHVGQDTITQVKVLSCVSHTTHITSDACVPGNNHTGKEFYHVCHTPLISQVTHVGQDTNTQEKDICICVAHHSNHK